MEVKFAARGMRNIIRQAGMRHDVFNIVRRRAVEQSAIFYENEMLPQGASSFETRYPLFNYALSKAPQDGLILEFGSYKGKSLRYLAQLTSAPIHGFDSFEGLQEEWWGNSPKGSFNVDGKLPKVPSSVVLHKGWFSETLPDFLAKNEGQIRFLHVDCDTYESSKYVLTTLTDRIKLGTVIQFDEFFGFPGWQYGEYKALTEWVEATGHSFRYLGFGYMSVAILITE